MTAIFEFSSSNGFSSFTLSFECREILIVDTGDENKNDFSFLVRLSVPSCGERSYEEWDTDFNYCLTTFQGRGVF